MKEKITRKKGFKRGFLRFSQNKLSVIGSSILLLITLLAILAPWVAPYPEDAFFNVNFKQRFQPPSLKHFMGTDEAGRDVFTRCIYGARISLMLAVVVLIISVSIGVPLGICAAYFGGTTEQIIMRITDIFLSIPVLVLAMAISVALKPSLQNMMLAISFVWWRGFCRIAYGQTLSVKQEIYILASKTLGCNNSHIVLHEILPNITSSIIVKMSLDAGYAILMGTSISFLGAGANPPTPEWGIMIASSRHYLPDIWWNSFFPGLFIFLTVLSFNLLGDGLRDFFSVESE